MGTGASASPDNPAKEANVDCVKIINDRLEELQAALSDARARTRVFIPDFADCTKAYRTIDNLELQIKTLESLRASIELKRRLA